ncbi:MAG: polysaccharide lyase [Phycisphaerae bacterium]
MILFLSVWMLCVVGSEPNESPREPIQFQCKFDKPTWYALWGIKTNPKNTRVILHDDRTCLEITVKDDGHYGTSFKYLFSQQVGFEPEELYASFDINYLDIDGYWGKTPGFDGTYHRGGWGGRTSDGINGWSARSSLDARAGECRQSFYVYHAQQKGTYGDGWPWQNAGETLLSHGRWYRIKQYIKLNTPGKADGVLRAWVNGRLAFDKTDIMFRKVNALRIFSYWVDFYFGGKPKAPREFKILLDNVKISTVPLDS